MILKRPLLQYVHYIALICWRGSTEALQLFSQTALILCDRTIAERWTCKWMMCLWKSWSVKWRMSRPTSEGLSLQPNDDSTIWCQKKGKKINRACKDTVATSEKLPVLWWILLVFLHSLTKHFKSLHSAPWGRNASFDCDFFYLNEYTNPASVQTTEHNPL